jgi:hypothetical protein
MADYEYDIFVSYRRMDDNWVRWTRENFVRSLRSLLWPALGKVEIFVDEQIETGASWPAHLARAHARSRLLVPILSRIYFGSDWCRLELALMRHRESTLGYRTAAKPSGLILPFVIDDGNSFPPEVQAMQAEKIHQFANPYMRVDSLRQEDFAEHLRKWCPCLEAALKVVPPFDPAWENLAHDQFMEMFRIALQTQKTLPALSLIPASGVPSSS